MNKKTTLLIISTLLVGALLLAACGQTPVAQASNASQTTNSGASRTLAVSGTGTVYLVPDIAYINIGVRSVADTVTGALNENNQLAMAITDALTAKGVDAKDIQTSNFNVYPQQQYDTNGQPTTLQYAVENTLSVTVRALASLGDMLDTAIKAGANNIYGISFDVKDRAAGINQARDLAIKDAQSNAQSVATSAGVTLGQLQNINVISSSTIQPLTSYATGMGGGGAKMVDSSVPVSAGQIVITFDASLVYAIQ